MSSINPNNIDGTYPIAGQDNDSQGFRNNFTNIRNNLTFASVEITELQQKAILKSAIAGEILNNNMNNTPLVGAQISRFTETLRNIGPVGIAGAEVSWSDAHFQILEITASTVLTLINWPTSGFYAKLRLEIEVTDTAHTLTLPASVTEASANSIQGCTSRVITFPTTGIYQFEFSTYDSGTTVYIEDVLRNYDIISTETSFSAIDITGNTASTSSTTGVLTVAGGVGVVGNIVTSSSFIGNVIGNVTGTATLATSATTATTVTASAQAAITSVGTLTSLTSSGNILTTGGRVGYATGAGGTVTQGSGSGKATTVVINKPTGTITLNNAALAANGGIVSFTMTNSFVSATDIVIVQHQSVGTLGAYTFTVEPSDGAAQIYVTNVTESALSQAIVLRVAVIKSIND
jgi:hypothetical protein